MQASLALVLVDLARALEVTWEESVFKEVRILEQMGALEPNLQNSEIILSEKRAGGKCHKIFKQVTKKLFINAVATRMRNFLVEKCQRDRCDTPEYEEEALSVNYI